MLNSEQHHEFADDEPWEVEPVTGLTDGADIFDALHGQLALVNCDTPKYAIEEAGMVLRETDPQLADDFWAAAAEWDFSH